MFALKNPPVTNICWFCGNSNPSYAKQCKHGYCNATLLPSISQDPITTPLLAWDEWFRPQGDLALAWRMQAIEWIRSNNGTAVRVGQGVNRVMFVRDHNGEKSVSWDSRTPEGGPMVDMKLWGEMGAQERMAVRSVLAGMAGGMELVDGVQE